jgi:DNA-binding CsgD family transcriptional regulator
MMPLDRTLIDYLYDLGENENLPEVTIAARLLDLVWCRARAAEDPRLRWETLTRRQQEIALLIHAGHTYFQIAQQLSLGRETIRTHARTIYKKMGVSGKKELRVLMRREEIFDEYLENYQKGGRSKTPGNPAS